MDKKITPKSFSSSCIKIGDGEQVMASYFLILHILKIFSPALEFFTLGLFLQVICILLLHLFLQFFFLFVKDIHDVLNQQQLSFTKLRQVLKIAMEGKDLESWGRAGGAGRGAELASAACTYLLCIPCLSVLVLPPSLLQFYRQPEKQKK